MALERGASLSGKGKGAILLGLVAAACVGMLLAPPFHQAQSYHLFADPRTLWGIPRALNVLSNVPFVIFGLWGLTFVWSARGRAGLTMPGERTAWAIFFGGVALTCFGSSYYHLQPDDRRLVWDRLPMTLGFMSVTTAIVGERVDPRLGKNLLVPLLVVGLASVVWWRQTDDLKPYALVQALPLVIIPLLLALYPPRYTRGADVFVVLAWYVLAKILEAADVQVYRMLGVVSGHSLKHVAASMACWQAMRMLSLRKPVDR